LSEDRYASLKDQCAENALSVTSNVLDHLAYKQDCNNSQNGTSANIILNELEGNMKLLANKQFPRLVTGQTSKIITMNVTSQVTKRELDDIFDEKVSMFAAAGGVRNLSASYKLPGTMLQDITALRSLTEISVQFDTFHHAPVVNGIQPISPLVGLRLVNSSSGTEILVSGLTQNVEITIPIVNQSVCELSDYQDLKLKCMYWAGDSYKSDGCSLKKVAAGYVTCACSHLTTIVVVPDGRLYRNSSATTLPSISSTTKQDHIVTTPAPGGNRPTPVSSTNTATVSTPKPPSVLPLQTVRIPIILPTAIKHVGYIEVVILAPENSFLNVTTNDVTPTCSGRIQGGNVNIFLSNRDPIVQRPTVKAVSCIDGNPSEICSRTFEIEQAFVVQMTVRLEGTIGSSDLSDDAKKKFLNGLADLIHVPAELMFIASVKDAKRRLFSVDLTVDVLANSDASAQQVKFDILKADVVGLISSVLNGLGLQGLVSGISIDAIVLSPAKGTPAPAPEPEKKSNTGVIVGSVVGAICFICVASSVTYHFLSLRSRKYLAEETMVTPPPPPALMSESMPLQQSKMPGGQLVMMPCSTNPMQAEPPPFPRDLAPPFPQIQRKEDYSEVKRMLQRTSNFSPAAVSQGFTGSSIAPVDVGPNEVELR